MSEPLIYEFTDRKTLDLQLANAVAERLNTAFEVRDQATLAVSGGSTPIGFFAALACCDIAWPKLTVTLADDRWVPATHAQSNERLVREQLLVGAAGVARFISLLTGDTTPKEAEAAVAARLAPLGTLDAMILGMGADGHFASLFPGSAELARGLDTANRQPVIATAPPTASYPRMSMTLARILDSRELILHIVGDTKRAVFERALDSGDAQQFPIAALVAAAPALTVYWAP